MRYRNLIIAGVAILLAAWALRDAALAVWLGAEAAGPPAVMRGDPRVELGALEVDFLPDRLPAPDKAQRVADLARAALRLAPLQASAVRDLALASQQLGDRAWLDKFVLAERLSRRDLPTQNALLRVAAQNNQYASAIAHLDKLLTMAPDLQPQFADAMVALVGDPVGRRILAGYGSRPWFPAFAAQAIAQVEDPRDTAALLLTAPMKRSDTEALGPALLNRLIGARDYSEARDFALRYARATPAALDDFRLSPATVNPRWAPLSWQLTSDVDVAPRLANDGSFDVDVRSGASTVVAQRVTLLSAGTYEFDQQVGANQGGQSLRLRWELNCQGADDRWQVQAWRQPVPLGSRLTHYQSRLQIPSDCPAQRWQLLASADEAQLSPSFRLAGISLKPAQGGVR